MNYELALELKNNGFPQKNNPNILLEGHYVNSKGKIHYSAETPTCVFVPSLEGLIEACGENFLALYPIRSPTSDKIKGWRAFTGNSSKEGKTPSEATARLWLVLNKK